jgi:CAAX prenyl protease-like protein
MPPGPDTQKPTRTRGWIDDLGASRPDIALMAPFLVYLALLSLRDYAFPYEWRAVAALVRGVGALAVVWVFRRHLPPWGRPHLLIAVPAGVLVAWGWVAGQHFFNDLSLPHQLPLPPFAGEFELIDPRDKLGAENLFWTTVVARIAVATTTVPIVEELFWRAFLLRALINWHDFDKVPLGRFTWFSFLATSLLSTVEHPANWGVSILCWMAYNALFCWKRSILCLVITHAVTNLALYVYVVRYNDWMFW